MTIGKKNRIQIYEQLSAPVSISENRKYKILAEAWATRMSVEIALKHEFH